MAQRHAFVSTSTPTAANMGPELENLEPRLLLSVDLVASEPLAPAAADLGELIQVQWLEESHRTTSLNETWRNRVYYSTDQVLDGADRELGSVARAINATGLASRFTWKSMGVEIPEDIEAGSGYILFAVDADNEVTETDENNNVVSAPIELNGLVSLTEPSTGSTVNVGDTERIEWSGGRASETIQIWSFGPNGWNLLADNVDAADAGWDWDTTGLPHGWYAISAQVNPGDGGDWYSSNSPDWVHLIEPANNAPSILLTTPATPQEITQGDSFDIQWTFSDADGDTCHVSLWAQSAQTGWFQVAGAEWLDATDNSFSWDTSSIQHGWYSFSAWVHDGSEADAVGSPNFVRVALPSNLLPTLTFLTPTAEASVTQGQNYDVTWTVNIPTGESMQVDLWAFYLDAGDPSADAQGRVWVDVSVGTVDASTGTFSLDTSSLDSGRWYAFAANLFSGDVFVAIGSDNWLNGV